MELLINRTDIAKHVQISDSCHDDVLREQISNAQFLDISDLLGHELYTDLLRTPGDVKYKALLNRADYVYSGVTYTNPGLKVVLVYYTNARYKRFGSSIDTPFSIVQKINPEESIPVVSNEKQALYKLNQQIGFKYWVSVRDFLDRNSSDYPLWRKDCTSNKKSFRLNKIS